MGLKSLLRYPLDVRRAERLLTAKSARVADTLTEPPIVLDLRSDQLLIDGGRHLACLAEHARTAGSALWLKCDRMLLAEIAHKPYGRRMLAAPGVSWVGRAAELPPRALVLSDHSSDDADADRRFHLLVGCEVLHGSAVMPYPMHPHSLEQTSPRLLERLRQSHSRHGLFFAGNQKTKYDNARLEQTFDILSRPRILRTLRQHFGDRTFQAFDNAEDASSAAPGPAGEGSTGKTRIILRDSTVAPIAPRDWLPTLARADFFLCPPGASQPICHNLVEAMSVGAIPLLEYHDRLTPALEDSVNAVCFRGGPGLVRAIHRIDRMPALQIERMRQKAIDYYESHLRGDRFLAELRDGRIDPPSGQISMPFHDRNLYRLTSADRYRRAA